MCTIVMLRGVATDHPLVIAANRDELYARPALPPRRLSQGPTMVAGIDALRGGTWLGVTADGFVAGVTNQRSYAPPDTSLRSRGDLVIEVLRTGSRTSARRLLEAIDPGAYNSFNLVYGDADELEVAYARRDSLTFEQVPEGVHVLPSDRLDSPEFLKVARLREALGEPAPWSVLEPRLEALLRDHGHPDESDAPEGFPRKLAGKLQAVCIHTELYGTRSSTIIALDRGRVARYLFADGPPCESAFVDYTHLL